MLTVTETTAVVDMVSLAFDISDELSTPYVTIPTRTYAKLCAAIEMLGGTVIDIVGNDPIYPGFTAEPDVASHPEEYAAAKAMQIISWSDNGLKAVDRCVYGLVLRMTKTVPGREDNYTAISLKAIAKRCGGCAKTASTALWALVDCGLLEAVTRKDSTTGHTIIYARAGAMPIYNDRYPQSVSREKDARRKRVCQDCGHDKFALKHVCMKCGSVQEESPHVDELVDTLADTSNTVSSRRIPTEDSSVGPLQHEFPPHYSISTNSKGENGECLSVRGSSPGYWIGPLSMNLAGNQDCGNTRSIVSTAVQSRRRFDI